MTGQQVEDTTVKASKVTKLKANPEAASGEGI